MMFKKEDITAVCLEGKMYHMECFEGQYSFDEVTPHDIYLEEDLEEIVAYCDHCEMLIS